MIQTDDDAANPSMDGPYWEKKENYGGQLPSNWEENGIGC